MKSDRNIASRAVAPGKRGGMWVRGRRGINLFKYLQQYTNLYPRKLKILRLCMETFLFNNSCPVFENFLIKELFKGLLISS